MVLRVAMWAVVAVTNGLPLFLEEQMNASDRFFEFGDDECIYNCDL